MKRKLGAAVLSLLAAWLLGGAVVAATQAQINQAIQDGLAWQASQQAPDGRIGSSYALAETATAVLAFENEGNFPGGGAPYSAAVERGLNYVFQFAQIATLSVQTYGYAGRSDNPDSNGNGRGVFFSHYSYMYETGLVMQAIVASNTPDRVVTTGPCAGMTYRQVMQDVVDFVAWAQVDGSIGRGGWRYNYYNNAPGYSDNSVAQWPVLGLIAAEQWGIFAPAWVKSELGYWVTYIQYTNGGSGYETPSSMVNVAKTGGLLVEFFYLGDTSSTPRVQRAVNYLNTYWNQAPYYWDGNRGHPYSMFSIFKGLELMKIASIPSAPANPDTPAGDWWGDYSHYLVGSQLHPAPGRGYWNGYYYWPPHLATAWYIVILQATVFPISVDVDVPGAACDLTGYDVTVHYGAERFVASGTLSLYRDNVLYDTVTLTDFIGSGTHVVNVTPETLGGHVWKAALELTGGGVTARAEDTDNTTVHANPRVSGIPDQVAPFATFDLDAFQTCECDDVDWSVGGVPPGWTVTIDADHVVTVVAPEGAYEPATLTFTATFHWPGIDCLGSDDAVFLPNRPPVAHPGRIYPDEKYYVDEGSTVMVDGSLSSDPDGDAIVSYEWDFDDDGTFEQPGCTCGFCAAAMDGPDERYIHLRVCDEHGACDIGVAEVEIENVAPTIVDLRAPVDPVDVALQPVRVEVVFTDPAIADTHTVTWDWGDGAVETLPAASPASRDHVYAGAGVYTVTMTVVDDDGGATSRIHEYIVVYDPSAGFVTGGGWILSPAGAYAPDPALTGKATFGFVSKYLKGATVPTGNTEFQFHAASLNFHSSSYEWLVVTGSNYARYKGLGTVDGVGVFKFMLWAGDGTPDTFRIRIWSEDASGVESVLYDNGFDQPIAGGNIVVHSGKK